MHTQGWGTNKAGGMEEVCVCVCARAHAQKGEVGGAKQQTYTPSISLTPPHLFLLLFYVEAEQTREEEGRLNKRAGREAREGEEEIKETSAFYQTASFSSYSLQN